MNVNVSFAQSKHLFWNLHIKCHLFQCQTEKDYEYFKSKIA